LENGGRRAYSLFIKQKKPLRNSARSQIPQRCLLRMQFAYDVAKTREHARDISIRRYARAAGHAERRGEGRILWARHEQG
jgi:hypothetical protein